MIDLAKRGRVTFFEAGDLETLGNLLIDWMYEDDTDRDILHTSMTMQQETETTRPWFFLSVTYRAST